MKLYNRKQLENIKLASKDDTRQTLNGLHFEGDSTVSTDGHKLMKVTWTVPQKAKNWPVNGVEWEKKDKPFILPRSTVEKALKNIPKQRGLAMPVLENVAIGLKKTEKDDPDKFVVQTSDLENTDNIEGKTVEGKFPNYKQVIPDYQNSESYRKVGISAHYLKEVCAQLEKYKNSSMVTLYMGNEKEPIVITADDDEGTEAEAVLMPMQL